MSEPDLLGTVHFGVGCVAVLAGLAALLSRKGQVWHRASGTIFAIAMLVLALSGLWLSLARGILFTVFLSGIAGHAVLTSWAAARRQAMLSIFLARWSGLVSGGLCLGAVAGGLLAASSPEGMLNDLPPEAFYLLAGVSFGLCVLDLFYARNTSPQRVSWLSRHLWRMGFAFFLATGIFFFGNNHVLPEVLRTPWVLSTPVLAVVIWTVFYALRTRFDPWLSTLRASVPVGNDAGR